MSRAYNPLTFSSLKTESTATVSVAETRLANMKHCSSENS